MLHDDIGEVIVFHVVLELDHIWMVHGLVDVDLRDKLLLDFGRGQRLFRDYLQGITTFAGTVNSRENLSKSTLDKNKRRVR